MAAKKYYLEALFSIFIVGLGQILKGETNKGVIMLLTFYLALPALVYASLIINGYVFIFALALTTILAIILWAYGVIDALLKNE